MPITPGSLHLTPLTCIMRGLFAQSEQVRAYTRHDSDLTELPSPACGRGGRAEAHTMRTLFTLGEGELVKLSYIFIL